MNYLAELMELRGLSQKEVQDMSGVYHVGYLMRLDTLEFVRKPTIAKLAKALDVTPRELVKGGKKMKDKILQTKVTQAAETLAKALRDYNGDEMILRVTVFTRDPECKEEGDPDGVPDFYSIVVHDANVDYDTPIDTTLSASARIYYDDEGIRKVIPYYCEGKADDLQS